MVGRGAGMMIVMIIKRSHEKDLCGVGIVLCVDCAGVSRNLHVMRSQNYRNTLFQCQFPDFILL